MRLDKDGINVTEMLISIKEDVASIKAKMSGVGDTDKKADVGQHAELVYVEQRENPLDQQLQLGTTRQQATSWMDFQIMVLC